MKIIFLTDTSLVRVSDEDYEYLNQWEWQRDSDGDVVRPPTDYTTMHGEVAGRMRLTEIEHVDRDKLNNQRDNLRVATSSCEQSLRSNNTSGYRGVYRSGECGKWRASICVRGRRLNLGLHGTAEAAARAYDRAARSHRGERAYTNFEED